MNASGSSEKSNPLHLAGSAVGIAVGWYAGMVMLIPFALVALTALVVLKLLPNEKPRARLVALISGHVLWVVLGCVMLSSWSQSIGHIIVLAASLCAYLFRPRRGSLIFILVVVVAEAAFAAYNLFGEPFGSIANKGLLVHTVLYLAAAAQAVALLRSDRSSGDESRSNESLQP